MQEAEQHSQELPISNMQAELHSLNESKPYNPAVVQDVTQPWERWLTMDDFPRDSPLFVSFTNAHVSEYWLSSRLAVKSAQLHAKMLQGRSKFLDQSVIVLK